MIKNEKFIFILISFLFAFLCVTNAQQKGDKKDKGKREGENKQESVFNTNVPMHEYDIVLGRPTDHSITVSILSYNQAEVYFDFGISNANMENTEKYALKKGEPVEIILNNLKKDSKYTFHVYYKGSNNSVFLKSQPHYFQTQRDYDEDFAFTVTADSHLDQNADTLNYKTSLHNAVSDSVDFHIDLGDTFMTDKYRDNYKEALNQYIAQRYYFGLLCNSSPLFLVQGNHDGESGQRLNGKKDNMTVWSNQMRKKYFPNPIPDGFYSGNETEEPFVGLPQNYYAWEWGNSMFIVLDPFWNTPRSGSENQWDRTLGKKQYDWLRKTLEESNSTYKFVFIHHLVGGVDLKGKARGGSEAARLFEWGGSNSDGSKGFKEHRPDWEMPIHDLLVKYKVSAVFHGHDHLFAKQELDGIVYQCLPQPGAKEYGNTKHAAEYGYLNGKFMNGPGYLRIKISNNKAIFDYVITDTKNENRNKEVVYSYELKKN